MRKECTFSHAVVDANYKRSEYPFGVPTIVCPRCGASLKPIIKRMSKVKMLACPKHYLTTK